MTKRTPKGIVHLQGIGKMPARPVSALTPGTRVVFNQGATYDIISTEQISPSTYRLTLRSTTTDVVYEIIKRSTSTLAVATSPRKGSR